MLKPELPDYMRDMEIVQALQRMTPRKSGKSNDVNRDINKWPAEPVDEM
ncbi:hypothetical protein [Alicyclobacillus fodiniaquatilis]|uniref:Uncharacterized protein n=1 Tax=Alicyclobacillus fodiniaquatilis TaxID=1661150 RepID=A0ABW4JH84_9BACL